jgi:diguanylate cyclase (GGDEF)-like protein/PAS domain S-box-containing protein
VGTAQLARRIGIGGHTALAAALRHRPDYRQAVIAHLPAMVRVVDRDGTVLLSDGRALAAIGRAPGDIVGRSIDDVLQHRPDILIDVRRALSGEEFCAVHEFGGVVWEVRYTPLRDGPEVVAMLLVAIDITARAHAEAAVRASEARLQDILDHASELIQIVDADDRLSFANRAWYSTLGHDAAALSRLTMREVVAPESWSHYRALVVRLLAGEDVGPVELILRARDGRRVAVEGQLNRRLEPGQPVAIRGIFRDVTRQKELEADLIHQATHDALTGLPNRALFLARLAAVANQAAPPHAAIAVFFLDLDGFKAVNDRLGHAAGDVVLVATARRLRDHAGRGTTVGRLGGDEFAILVTDAGDERALARRAERIAAALAEPVILGEAEVRVRASIGVALGQANTHAAEALLHAADALMYRAKRNGPGRYVIAAPGPHADG